MVGSGEDDQPCGLKGTYGIGNANGIGILRCAQDDSENL